MKLKNEVTYKKLVAEKTARPAFTNKLENCAQRSIFINGEAVVTLRQSSGTRAYFEYKDTWYSVGLTVLDAAMILDEVREVSENDLRSFTIPLPRPKYESRATRLSHVVSSAQDVVDEIDLFISSFDVDSSDFDKQEFIAAASELSLDFEWGEVESLKDEIESWRGGMQGTNLENSDKYTQLEECASALDAVVGAFESFSAPEFDPEGDPQSFIDELENIKQYLEEGISEGDSVEFPGMY